MTRADLMNGQRALMGLLTQVGASRELGHDPLCITHRFSSCEFGHLPE
jgi:hypothetical protein